MAIDSSANNKDSDLQRVGRSMLRPVLLAS